MSTALHLTFKLTKHIKLNSDIVFWRIPLLKPNLFQRRKNSLSEVVGRLEIRGTWIRLYIPLPVALHFDAIPFLGSCGVDAVGGSFKRDETGEKQAEPYDLCQLVSQHILKISEMLASRCCCSDQLFRTGLTSAIIVRTIYSLVHRRSRSRRPRNRQCNDHIHYTGPLPSH